MRIRELFENQGFKEEDYVEGEGSGKHSINYDLAEDLAFYMHNNDDCYRKHVYPVIAHCLHQVKNKKSTSPEAFAKAVDECYENYIKEYPIRQLPDKIDKKLKEEICTRLHDELRGHIEHGHYKD